MKKLKPDEYYTKLVIKDTASWKPDELEKEFNRLAKETNRRLERLEKNFPRSEIVKNTEKSPMFDEFVKRGGRIDRNALSSQMSANAKFVDNPLTTVAGFKKQISASVLRFNKMFARKDPVTGREIIPRKFTSKNIFNLFDFLEDVRERFKNQILPSSDELVDIFVEGKRLNMNMDDLAEKADFWAEHYEEMQELKVIRRRKPVSSEMYEKNL